MNKILRREFSPKLKDHLGHQSERLAMETRERAPARELAELSQVKNPMSVSTYTSAADYEVCDFRWSNGNWDLGIIW